VCVGWFPGCLHKRLLSVLSFCCNNAFHCLHAFSPFIAVTCYNTTGYFIQHYWSSISQVGINWKDGGRKGIICGDDGGGGTGNPGVFVICEDASVSLVQSKQIRNMAGFQPWSQGLSIVPCPVCCMVLATVLQACATSSHCRSLTA